jgi:hypothetical protein
MYYTVGPITGESGLADSGSPDSFTEARTW